MDASLDPPGATVPPDELALGRAQQFYQTLVRPVSPYARFLDARSLAGAIRGEAVVFEVDVEVPQHLVHDIRRTEILCALFTADEAVSPMVLVLRSDFPSVPHLLPPGGNLPAHLCLYEEPHAEVRLTWTAASMLHRVREWLALTARGELHGADQPLEPLLLAHVPVLLLPHDLGLDGDHAEPLHVYGLDDGSRRIVYVAQHQVDRAVHTTGTVRWLGLVVLGKPQVHGVIRRVPDTLLDLHDFLLPAGVDLLACLAGWLRQWSADKERLQQSPILIIALPKTRVAAGEIEGTEHWAFLCEVSLAKLGEALGIWQIVDGSVGAVVGGAGVQPDQVRIPLHLLNPTLPLTPSRAAELNATLPSVQRIVGIGLGTLGSQVFMNLVRAGFGVWTLVDSDQLLPHNVARHELDGSWVGHSKALAMAHAANGSIAGASIAKAVVADAMRPADKSAMLRGAFQTADIILDMSASLAVARHIAHDIEGKARRASIFLNPSGTDLVLLAEDNQRAVPLDWLEMLYYRHVLLESALVTHFQTPAGRIRYARACRDVSSTLPQDLAALHSGIGSWALRQALAQDTPTLRIWSVTPRDYSVSVTSGNPSEPIVVSCGEWRVYTDGRLLKELRIARARRLPVETGGVLVGCFDTQRRIVYVVDYVSSPPDSTEWPTLYIRGCSGLPARLTEIGQVTGSMLRYVGEWHSHPRGHGSATSRDDQCVLGWLAEHMTVDGLPALMLIVGEDMSWHMRADGKDTRATLSTPAWVTEPGAPEERTDEP